MNSDSVKWLIAGLVGGLVTLAFLGTGVFLGVRFIMAELEGDYVETEPPVYGPDEWARREADYLENKEEEDAELAATGLLDRYAVVSIHDDTREQLYEKQDFGLVEERLAAQFAAADTPLKKHRYSQHVQHIGNMYYGDDIEGQWKTLTSWVEQRPDAYQARLIRGAYAVRYAWYFRGNTYSDRVTQKGWDGFHRYLEVAQDDLETARQMNPDDPESTAFRITVESALGSDVSVCNNYYDQTVAIDPYHYSARMSKLNFAQPKWGGSWEAIEAIIADAKAHQDGFPLLVDVVRRAEYNMASRGEEYEGTWNSTSTWKMMYEAYRAQAEQSPDDYRVQADMALHAVNVHAYDDAYRAMAIVGDRFPRNNDFEDLPNYHKWRGIVAAEYSSYDEILGTPREQELIEEALALTPKEPTVAGLYLAFLARKQDDALTSDYFENVQDPYLATGAWGNPPNYVMMEGMAKAARSDDWGYKGKRRERPLVDEALALAPDNAFVLLVAAEYHISRDEFDDAEVHLLKAREIDPDYMPALHIMGWLHFHQKRWDEGIATAEAFLATPPSPYLEKYADDAKEIIDLCKEKKAGGR